MDNRHCLEWNSNPAFKWKECKQIVLHRNQLTHEDLHNACGECYEIQRAKVEMTDGYSVTIQSATKNKVNITPRYVSLAESVKRKNCGVYQYRSYTCRREYVKRIIIWLAYPPQIRINKKPDPSDKH